MGKYRFGLLILATLALSTVPAWAEGSTMSPEAALARVSVIGASVSAGYQASQNVASFLTQAKLPSVADRANEMMVFNPLKRGSEMIHEAIADRATLVVGLDFLFWFAYGKGTFEERMALLEVGLVKLHVLTHELPEAYLVLGDLPDMSGADPEMLEAADIPKAKELLKLNERIRDWASTRPHVILVPVAQWMIPLRKGGEMVRLSSTLDPVDTSTLLDKDRLHLNENGIWYFLILTARMLRERFAWSDIVLPIGAPLRVPADPEQSGH